MREWKRKIEKRKIEEREKREKRVKEREKERELESVYVFVSISFGDLFLTCVTQCDLCSASSPLSSLFSPFSTSLLSTTSLFLDP